MVSSFLDPVAFTQALIQCPSVTPHEGGALDLLEQVLTPLGFRCQRLRFQAPETEPVDNLYARWGTDGPIFGYAGHTDVVPVGDPAAWCVDPFSGASHDGAIWGRGASDMKGSIAAFVSAAQTFIQQVGTNFPGSIALVITGDEEGPAINGTVKILDWMRQNDQILEACLVGEPTNPEAIGDMIKIGRRGSLNGTLTVKGTGGHVAYPHLADNPLPRLVRLLDHLAQRPLDSGTAHFPASTCAITDIHVGNPASNVIPAEGSARFNIRFNTTYTPESLTDWIYKTLTEAQAGPFELDIRVSGDSFLTPPGRLSQITSDAVHHVTGRSPDHSTTGGTSDARFIKDMCPVIECGLVNKTIHKTDEHARIDHIKQLTDIYLTVLRRYFAAV